MLFQISISWSCAKFICGFQQKTENSIFYRAQTIFSAQKLFAVQKPSSGLMELDYDKEHIEKRHIFSYDTTFDGGIKVLSRKIIANDFPIYVEIAAHRANLSH